jgi:hypothetical protein
MSKTRLLGLIVACAIGPLVSPSSVLAGPISQIVTCITHARGDVRCTVDAATVQVRNVVLNEGECSSLRLSGSEWEAVASSLKLSTTDALDQMNQGFRNVRLQDRLDSLSSSSEPTGLTKMAMLSALNSPVGTYRQGDEFQFWTSRVCPRLTRYEIVTDQGTAAFPSL